MMGWGPGARAVIPEPDEAIDSSVTGSLKVVIRDSRKKTSQIPSR